MHDGRAVGTGFSARGKAPAKHRVYAAGCPNGRYKWSLATSLMVHASHELIHREAPHTDLARGHRSCARSLMLTRRGVRRVEFSLWEVHSHEETRPCRGQTRVRGPDVQRR